MGVLLDDTVWAVQFRTGLHLSGYAADGVTLDIAEVTNAASVKLKASIFDDDAGVPGSLVQAVGEHAGPTVGELTIDADSDIHLNPSTDYWLVVELDDAPVGSVVDLGSTDSVDLDPGAATGWSLGGAVSRLISGASWPTTPLSPNPFPFALLGEPNSPALIGNLGQPESDTTLPVGFFSHVLPDIARAVRFRTGPNLSAYAADGVMVEVSTALAAASVKLKAAIYDDAGGEPGSLFRTVGEVTGPTAGVLRIDADSDIPLRRSTDYWLVVELDDAPPTSLVNLAGTDSGAPDPGAPPGWALGSASTRTDSGASWGSSVRFKFALLGERTAQTGPGPILFSTLGVDDAGDRDVSIGHVSEDAPDRLQRLEFQTGLRRPLGYTLTGVTVDFHHVAGLDASVKLRAHIHAVNGTRIATVGEAAVSSADVGSDSIARLFIPALDDIHLESSVGNQDENVFYRLVLELEGQGAGESIDLVRVEIDEEDPGSETGWGVLGRSHRDSPAHSAVWDLPGSVRFALHGEPTRPVVPGCAAENVSDTSEAVSIPDAALRAVVEKALGKSSGATITYAELATIQEIRAENSGIASMEGLQYAVGLRQLRLEGNNITSAIDFCGLTLLEHLDLSRNSISGAVDLTHVTILQSLWLGYNHITSVAMPTSPELRTMSVFQNRITTITWDGEHRAYPGDKAPNLVNFNIWNNPIFDDE